VPPVITTGIGPQGRRIVHNQPNESTPASQVFDDSQIDPSLLGLAATPPRPSLTQGDPDETPCRLISTNSHISSLETPKLRAPKPSTFGGDLTNAMAKARQNVQHVPKKRSLEDVIIESSR
jgi:hypothetical protein